MTKNITATLIVLSSFALGSFLCVGSGGHVDSASSVVTAVDVPVTVSASPLVTVMGGDVDQRALLEEALARFRHNGLDLPDLEVRFFDDEDACRGKSGLFQKSFVPWRILICARAAFVPAHELAHAWEAANLTDDDRDRYVVSSGLPTWNDSDQPWSDRGVENLAVLIQRTLTIDERHLQLDYWAERVEAYELVTGLRSPAVTVCPANSLTSLC